MKPLFAFLLAASLLLCSSCGGGGGGSGGGSGTTNVSVYGRVIWAGTGGAPSPAATVRAGSASTLTSTVDGSFSFDVPVGTSSVTVTDTIGGSAIVATFTFGAAAAASDLGDLYIGPEEVSITGRALDAQTSAPIAGATVSIAGRRATTASNGTFTVTQVAYSSSALAVFLGLQGTVDASGWFTAYFAPASSPSSGSVSVGDISLTPSGGDSPPPLPYDLKVSVTPSGSGSTVQVLSSGVVIRTAVAGSDGSAAFWVPAGTYTVKATKGGSTGSAPAAVASSSTPVTVNVVIP